MLISTNTGLYSARLGKPRYSLHEAVRFFAKSGFEALDVNFAATIYTAENCRDTILDGDWESKLDAVLKAATENGIAILSSHTPFISGNAPHSARVGLDEASFEKMALRAIRATAFLGARYAVMHPRREASGEVDIAFIIEDLKPYVEEAAAAGIALAVENMAWTDESQLIEIADRLGCGICWDVGHANIKGLDQPAALKNMGKRVKVLHLHDNYGAKDSHNAPYFGTINWRDIAAALGEIGFEGAFNYEVAIGSVPDALREAHAAYLVQAAKELLGRL